MKKLFVPQCWEEEGDKEGKGGEMWGKKYWEPIAGSVCLGPQQL